MLHYSPVHLHVQGRQEFHACGTGLMETGNLMRASGTGLMKTGTLMHASGTGLMKTGTLMHASGTGLMKTGNTLNCHCCLRFWSVSL